MDMALRTLHSEHEIAGSNPFSNYRIVKNEHNSNLSTFKFISSSTFRHIRVTITYLIITCVLFPLVFRILFSRSYTIISHLLRAYKSHTNYTHVVQHSVQMTSPTADYSCEQYHFSIPQLWDNSTTSIITIYDQTPLLGLFVVLAHAYNRS